MAINYDQDIAPLRQQYFPMLMGERGFDQAMKYRQETLMPVQMHTMKMEQHAMSRRSQDLAYENQKLELTRSRQKTQSQLKFMERLPSMMQELENITGDPDKDPYTATKSLIALQMKYLPDSQHNPLIGNLFTTAGNSIGIDRLRKEKEESAALRVSEKEESREFGLMAQLAQVGDKEGVMALAGEDIDPLERGYVGLAETYNERGLASAEAVVDKNRRAALGKTAARYKEFEGALRGMTSPKSSNEWASIDLNVGNTKQITTKITEEFLDNIDIDQVKGIYVDLMKRSGSNINADALKKQGEENPRELYQMTLEKVLEQRRLLEQYTLDEEEQGNPVHNAFYG